MHSDGDDAGIPVREAQEGMIHTSTRECFFLGGVLWCFAGVFAKRGRLSVVFWWCKRGGWVVKRGVLAVSFLASKNAPWFLSLFFGGFRFGNVETPLLMRVCAGCGETM
jgi:hypothetical protein